MSYFLRMSSVIKFFRACRREFDTAYAGAETLISFGFRFQEDLADDIRAMDRLELCLKKEPGVGNDARIEEAGRYIQRRMIAPLKGRQRGFLGSLHALRSLKERAYTLGIASLGVMLEEYEEAIEQNEGVDSLRNRYLTLASEIEKFESDDKRTTEERIRQTITPKPATPRKGDRKSERRLRDQNLRAQMKGKTSGGGKKQRQSA